MTSTLTYLEFLAAFLAAPAVGLAAVVARRTDSRRRVAAGLAVLVAIAVVYTAPWDGYLIRRGVWSYGDGVVTAWLGPIPLGEWLFFGAQTVVAGLWYRALAPRIRPGTPTFPAARKAGAAAWVGVALVGLALAAASPRTFYLGAILAWAAPVVAFLWAVGGPVLWDRRRLVALAVAVPSAYLWAVDRFAIGRGLWTISPAHSTDVHVAGLPVEEALFFVLTNLLVVQGLVLFDWTVARADERGPAYALAGLLPAASRVSRRWR